MQKFFIYYILLLVFSINPLLLGIVLFVKGDSANLDMEEVKQFFYFGGVLLAGVSVFLIRHSLTPEAVLKRAGETVRQLGLTTGGDPYLNLNSLLVKLLSSLLIFFVISLVINESISLVGFLYAIQAGGLIDYITFAVVQLLLNLYLLLCVLKIKPVALDALR